MALFAKQGVWNANEFGLFFRQPSRRSLSATPVRSKMKVKTRPAFLACCNSDGTEKYSLMVIGRARRPRPFGRKSGKKLGFDYRANRKAWMTKYLFFLWLEPFDLYIGQTSG